MLKSGDVGSGIFQSSLLLESKENVLDFFILWWADDMADQVNLNLKIQPNSLYDSQ